METFLSILPFVLLIAFVAFIVHRRAKRKGKTSPVTRAVGYVRDRVKGVRTHEQER